MLITKSLLTRGASYKRPKSRGGAICREGRNNRLMHRSNASLFDHLVGAGEDRLRHGNPQRFRRFGVDHQFRPTEFVPGVMSRIVVNR